MLKLCLKGAKQVKIYVYLDESGSIHKNSKTQYFAVGGYYTFEEDKVKIKSQYKRANLALKRIRNINLCQEIKAYDMSEKEKINILNKIQDINTFRGCVKVFDKYAMRKGITDSNIFFNYAVKILIIDCILPELDLLNFEGEVEFVISIDNRNIRVGELNNLETYLKTEFCLQEYDFSVKYYDSKTKYEIQLADLIVNSFYNSYKDIAIVKDLMKELKAKNFNVSLFPQKNKI